MTPNADLERIIRVVFDDYKIRRLDENALTLTPKIVNEHLDRLQAALLRALPHITSSETP